MKIKDIDFVLFVPVLVVLAIIISALLLQPKPETELDSIVINSNAPKMNYYPPLE